MKTQHLLCALLLFIFSLASCKKNAHKSEAEYISKSETNNKDLNIVKSTKESLVETKDQHIIVPKRNYEILTKDVNRKDTVILSNTKLYFKPLDTAFFKPYYNDSKKRDSLTISEGNWHKRAQIIENYLANESSFKDYFSATDSSLSLKLNNDSLLILPKWDSKLDEGYNFENLFKNQNLYLLRVQWGEGNEWMLVDKRNGKKYKISGRPFFSPSKNSFITINVDLEAEYSFNGIEYFTVKKDTVQLKWKLVLQNWGPINAKWTSDSTVELQRTFMDESQNYDYKEDYVKMTISESIN